jgi:hypothetical protein
LFGLAGLVAVIVWSAVSIATNESDLDTQVLVVQECKDSVAAQLTYPADADFPFLDPTPTKDSSGAWHVSGSVSAKNALGGTHQLFWTCTVDSAGVVHTAVRGQ